MGHRSKGQYRKRGRLVDRPRFQGQLVAMATKRKLTGLRRPECSLCNDRALYEVKTLTAIRYYCGRCYLLLTDFIDDLRKGLDNGNLPSTP